MRYPEYPPNITSQIKQLKNALMSDTDFTHFSIRLGLLIPPIYIVLSAVDHKLTGVDINSMLNEK